MKILVSEATGFTRAAHDCLSAYGNLQLGDLDRQALLQAVVDCDVLWVRLRNQIDEEVLASAPRLRVIVTATTGLNHIDTAAAAARGIRVLSLRGEVDFLRNIRATAELCVGLMLGLLRKIPVAFEDVKVGGWNRDRFRGNELSGLSIGLVGYGRLGTLVAGYLRAFGSCVFAYDPFVTIRDPHVTQVRTLTDLLYHCRMISVHASYSVANENLLDQSSFACMHSGSWFVNTARGELVDEQALLDALVSGHLAGAAIDVLRNEPEQAGGEHPLVKYAREHDNLLLTPHIGGCTKESMEQAELFMTQKLVEVLSCVE